MRRRGAIFCSENVAVFLENRLRKRERHIIRVRIFFNPNHHKTKSLKRGERDLIHTFHIAHAESHEQNIETKMLRASTMHAPVTSTSFSSRRCSAAQSSSSSFPAARTRFSIGKNRSNRNTNKRNSNNNNKRGSLQVSASIFGVGAPEALVIGVVALVVFGPKGLADLAKGLGETLRAFKPTIQELQQVSQEFQETLSNEVGIDDISKPLAPQKRVTPPPIREVNVEDEERIKEMNASVQFEMTEQAKASQAMAEANDAVSEDMIEASKRAAWGGAVPGELSAEEPQFVAEVAETTAPAEEPVMRVMDYTQPAAPAEEEEK